MSSVIWVANTLSVSIDESIASPFQDSCFGHHYVKCSDLVCDCGPLLKHVILDS